MIIPQKSACWQRCLEHIRAYRGTFETGRIVLGPGKGAGGAGHSEVLLWSPALRKLHPEGPLRPVSLLKGRARSDETFTEQQEIRRHQRGREGKTSCY